MELKATVEADFDVEMTDDSNSRLVRQTEHSDMHRLSSLSPGHGQGRSDGKVRDGGPPSRPLSDFETAKDSELRVEYIRNRTDHLDDKSDQFGIDGGTTVEETHSSPTVKLAGQKLQQQSSEDAAPMDSSIIQVDTTTTAITQDLADKNYGLEQSPSDCQTLGHGDAHCGVGKDAFSTHGDPATWDKDTSLPTAGDISTQHLFHRSISTSYVERVHA